MNKKMYFFSDQQRVGQIISILLCLTKHASQLWKVEKRTGCLITLCIYESLDAELNFFIYF